jgi:hypothetical protein
MASIHHCGDELHQASVASLVAHSAAVGVSQVIFDIVWFFLSSEKKNKKKKKKGSSLVEACQCGLST